MRRTLLAVIALMSTAAIVLAACGGDDDDDTTPGTQPPSTEPATPLEGTSWLLDLQVLEVDLPDDVVPVTAIFEDGRVSGSSGCNTYGAEYTLDGDSLTIGDVATTLMACEPPLMAVEQAYTKRLGDVASFEIDGDRLTLLDGDGEPVLEYAAQSGDAIVGDWNARAILVGTGFSSVVLDTEVTATFGHDGSLAGSSGCNNYTGGYTIDGDTIDIPPVGGTRMMCAEPEGVMEQEAAYLAALDAATTFAVSGDTLDLFDAKGRRVVEYTRAG